MVIPDNETGVDLLNNEAIALSIVELLKEHSSPITIGVHGDWGAGKSSMLKMIEEKLKHEKKTLCIRFDGWRFQGLEDAKISLIEGIITEIVKKKSTLAKTSDGLKDLVKRVDWIKLAKHTGGLALTAYSGIPTPDQINAAKTVLSSLVQNPSKVANTQQIKDVLKQVNESIKKTNDSKRIPEEVREFHKSFDKFLKQTKVDQLVVLIDDLDRCLPETVIETLEAIRLFLFTNKTAFIIAADEEMIEYSVRQHFPNIPNNPNQKDYARNYLEKLIQVPFRLPVLGETEARIYISLLLIENELGSTDKDFHKLIAAAKDKMRKPWTTVSLDTATVKKNLGEKTTSISKALNLADQIGTMIAQGTQGNPRQIKRFLNTLLLRKSIAKARGFKDSIRLPILAKLLLAERFIPDLYKEIANIAMTSKDGLCSELSALENSKISTKVQNQKKVKNPQLAKLFSKKSAQQWSRINPKLYNVDLRPYFFVAKENREYSIAPSLLSIDPSIIENLLKGKLKISQMKQSLKQLNNSQAGEAFEIIRGQIVSKDSFLKKPAGIDGLIALVEIKPLLQTNLIDFIKMLPPDKTGAWAIGGWDSAIKDPNLKKSLQESIKSWTKSKNPFLKKAVKIHLKTIKS